MQIGQLPSWAIAVSLLLIAIVFGHTAFFARAPFEVAGLRFGPVLNADVSLEDAVIAFHKSKEDNGGCPLGWRVFEPVASRFIVGAGPTSSKGARGEPLTSYVSYRDNSIEATGGAETHVLSIAEMPGHSHELEDAYFDRDREGRPFVELAGGSEKFDVPGRMISTNVVGGGQPHNNMPPYIALYFCKKD